MTRPQSPGRILSSALFGAFAFMSLSVVAGGCLDRPVAPATPTVSARIVSPAKQNKVTKIDLLFMIDNSSSMADKQSILAQAVPDLVNRLVNPVCIDPMTGMTTGNRNANGSCQRGEPDFDPINNIHIGIISSSLGAHGATGVCDDAGDVAQGRTFPHNNDHGHLIARDAMDRPVLNNVAFLNWTGPPADPNMTVTTPFTSMVTGVGQHGCGYEASLESIYRFLVDPDPYDTYSVDTTKSPPLGVEVLNGKDNALLQQRADFLRPDSLVAVIALSDENDCSVADVTGGQGFYSLTPPSGLPSTSALGHGTSACLTNPNDPCCFNCGEPAHAGCPSPQSDPECLKGAWSAAEDPLNLRCFDQKRRYGVDFLWPVGKYINAFTNNMVLDRNNQPVQNPLYDDLSPTCNKATKQGCLGERDKSLVFLAGIVGVPWQDIAVDAMDLTKGYLTATQIADMNIWPKIVGDPVPVSGGPPIAPTDTHMIESVGPRAGLSPPTSPPTADRINGHEWDPSQDTSNPNSDLQYACIFDLNPTKPCATVADCDCGGSSVMNMRSPLCQNPVSGAYSSTQVKAKAYPGIRELQVLQGLGAQAIVASICPANAMNQNAIDFGYRPAIAALISRLRVALRGRCLPRQLAVTADGSVPCVIVEAFNPPAGGACNCADQPGRVNADASTITAEVSAQGKCFCEIVQLTGADRRTCQTNVSPPGNVTAGWCYVDPSQTNDPLECPIVSSCPATDRRIIRFVTPPSEPRNGATAFIMCQEQSFPSTGTVAVDPCP